MGKFLVGLVAVGWFCPGAGADPGPKPHADLRIREMVSFESKGFLLRALKGYQEIDPFIVVEKVSLGLTEGDEPALLASWRVRDMKGGAVLAESSEGDDFTNMRWNGGLLEFTFSKHASKLTCTVSNLMIGEPAVACLPARP